VGQSAEELRRDIERTRDDLGGTLDAIGDRVSPGRIMQRRTSAVRDRFTSVKDSIMGSATDAYSSATGSVQDAGHGMADRASSAASTVTDTPQLVKRQTQGNPLAAGIIAFGGGLLLASVLPSSRAEQRAATNLQDHLEPLKDKAIEAGQQMKESLQETAQSAAQEVKQTAQSAAEEVKQGAQSSASDVKDQAQSAAGQVKDQATS